MKQILLLLVIGLLCVLFFVLMGHRDLTRNEQVIDSIGKLDPVIPDGIQFKPTTSSRNGGTAAKLSYLHVAGDLLSDGKQKLPHDFLDGVKKNIAAHLKAEGCTLVDGGQGQGLSPNYPVVHVRYTLQDSEGHVSAWLVQGVDNSEDKKVLGRLMLTVYEAR